MPPPVLPDQNLNPTPQGTGYNVVGGGTTTPMFGAGFSDAVANATKGLFWRSILGTDDPAAKRDLLIYVGAGLLVVIALLGVFR